MTTQRWGIVLIVMGAVAIVAAMLSGNPLGLWLIGLPMLGYGLFMRVTK